MQNKKRRRKRKMEKSENIRKNKDMISLLYKAQEEKLDKIITKVNKEITSESKNINIEKVIAESNNPKELKEIFDKIENNYNIKITRYNKEFYERGFIDGVNLILNCFQ